MVEIQVIKPVFLIDLLSPFGMSDSILFIDGHNRNNLYELLISELHDHPSFSYHIANIQKWHDEFFKSFTNGKLSSGTSNSFKKW